MSSGKTIIAYGVSSIYHAEPKIFLQRLSLALESNLSARFMDTSSKDEEDDIHVTVDKGFKNSLHINIDTNTEYGQDYMIVLPIEHEEESLSISFYPNNIVSALHIPFTAVWFFFINNILSKTGEALGGWDKYLQKMEAVRAIYLPIFKKLGCYNVILSTDVHYHWVNKLVWEADDKPIAFTDLLKAAETMDGITFFNLEEVFDQKWHTEIERLFNKDEYYKVAFLDKV